MRQTENNKKQKSSKLRTTYYVLPAEHGQSSLEVLIALAILTLTISAAIVVGFGNQSATVDTQLNNRALYLARQELEVMRAAARRDFSSVASSTSQDGVYTKQVIVNTIGTYTKEVTAKLTWQLSPLQTKELAITTVITDWRTAYEQSGTGDGGGGLTGDWTNPLTAGTFDLGPGNDGTDIAVKGQVVFLTGNASDDKKDDFYSIDVSNVNSPSLLTSINTGDGLTSIGLWNNYAYAGGEDDDEQLHVIDISSPGNPTLVTTSTLVGNTEDVNAVFAKDDYVYIGTNNSLSGAEVQIFDVTNPGNPTHIASVEVGDHANDIFVFKDRAYVATSKIDKEIMILDVTNPASPTEIASYNHPSGVGKSVFVTSLGTAYLGTNTTFAILNTSDLGDITVTGSMGAGGNVQDLYIRDELAFLATDQSNAEFKVVNIENPANPTSQSTFNFPQVATGITYRDNVVYVSVRSNEALRIITSSP